MEGDIERLLDGFSDLRSRANVNACFGEPVTVEGRTVIPVARITYAFRVAGRESSVEPGEEAQDKDAVESHGGGGSGMRSSPLGVVELTSQETRFRSITDRRMVVLASLLLGAWCVFWLSRALATISKRGD